MRTGAVLLEVLLAAAVLAAGTAALLSLEVRTLARHRRAARLNRACWLAEEALSELMLVGRLDAGVTEGRSEAASGLEWAATVRPLAVSADGRLVSVRVDVRQAQQTVFTLQRLVFAQ